MAVPRLLVTRSDEVMSGAVVFTGTRVPAQTLLDYLEEGDTRSFLGGLSDGEPRDAKSPRCCHSHPKRFCLTSAIGYARLIACSVGDEKFRCIAKRVWAQEVRRKEPGGVGRSKKLTTKAGISSGISDIRFCTASPHPQGCGDRARRTRPGALGGPGTNLTCPSGSKSFASHASPSPRPNCGVALSTEPKGPTQPCRRRMNTIYHIYSIIGI